MPITRWFQNVLIPLFVSYFQTINHSIWCKLYPNAEHRLFIPGIKFRTIMNCESIYNRNERKQNYCNYPAVFEIKQLKNDDIEKKKKKKKASLPILMIFFPMHMFLDFNFRDIYKKRSLSLHRISLIHTNL